MQIILNKYSILAILPVGQNHLFLPFTGGPIDSNVGNTPLVIGCPGHADDVPIHNLIFL